MQLAIHYMSMKTVIFDFGANKGQNLEYYLKKADIVVAVEAIPQMCENIIKKFKAEISSDKLIVINAAIVADNFFDKEIEFYVNNNHPELSRSYAPLQVDFNWTKILVPTINCADVVQKYISQGFHPLYCKFDIEGADLAGVKSLLGAGIVPDFISAELHDYRVLTELVNSGSYQCFRIEVAGYAANRYKNKSIINLDNEVEKYRFTNISAGPFGLDLKDKWYGGKAILQSVSLGGFGAKDLHCSRDPNHLALVHSNRYLLFMCISFLLKISKKILINLIRNSIPGPFKSFLKPYYRSILSALDIITYSKKFRINKEFKGF